ncbi:hypothetical protein [Streptomyces sp. NPDC001652]|uniref:hypothetical protein n=1 Tax=Streptomyces sp. NPDC001652 TaxID=3154393 RepID=UPI00332D49A7
MTDRSLTQAAGQAVAAAVHAVNTAGLDHPDTEVALAAAVALTDSAQASGATAQEIRQAGGLLD